LRTTMVKTTRARTSSHKGKLPSAVTRAKAFHFLDVERVDMRRLLFLLVVAFGSVLAAVTAGAQRLELPAGPDRDVVSRACQTCHDLSMVIAAKGLTRDGWDAAIEEMISYGMRVEPDERSRILEYLSSRLGPS
jgi:hypothetical protein